MSLGVDNILARAMGLSSISPSIGSSHSYLPERGGLSLGPLSLQAAAAIGSNFSSRQTKKRIGLGSDQQKL